MEKAPKVIFVVTEDWAFLSHRLPMARAAKDMGCDVVIAARDNGHTQAVEDKGFRFIPIPMNRSGTNPIKELRTVWALAKLFWKERPDIVHCVALKPILDGSLAARCAPVGNVINTFAGMGSIFIGEERRGMRLFLIRAFRWLMRSEKVHVVVQNEDDEEMLTGLGIAQSARTTLIRGSGIEMEMYSSSAEPEGIPVAVMVSRLSWDKGVQEFVDAARVLKERGVGVKMTLVGAPDPSNPRCVPEETVQAWQTEGVIDWQGHRNDILKVYTDAHIAVLPSYREGTPKSLLEAAACGRAIITTDVPGCRQMVEEGKSGLLVPPRDGHAIADAIERLAKDPELRISFGRNARERITRLYSSEVVAQGIKSLYTRLLASS